MGTYKQKRSRKPIDTNTLRLRIQDALSAIEPVFLGEAGEDYDKEEMELKLKAGHAYSQLASKLRRLIELDELEERVSELEEMIQEGGTLWEL